VFSNTIASYYTVSGSQTRMHQYGGRSLPMKMPARLNHKLRVSGGNFIPSPETL
jgi:hypothetical protein